jgi:hydroxymethylglutaryl-CoA lyase
MPDLPRRVVITEEGPREGFQSEPPGIETARKLALIEALSQTGLRQIVCASFVNQRLLPQMADAEDIARGIVRRPDIEHLALWLNRKGFERARASGLDLRAVVTASASATFLMRNNRRTPQEGLDDQRDLCAAYDDAELPDGPAFLFTAFGCNYEGAVPVATALSRLADLVTTVRDAGRDISHVMLCDTVGTGNPALVERLVSEVRSRWPELPVGLHLHDTRGLGIANAAAGLRLGVDRFDASIGGLGGCPFAGNRAAAGNIATEELVFMCHEMGIETGIDLDALLQAGEVAAETVGHPLPSRLLKAGRLVPLNKIS